MKPPTGLLLSLAMKKLETLREQRTVRQSVFISAGWFIYIMNHPAYLLFNFSLQLSGVSPVSHRTNAHVHTYQHCRVWMPMQRLLTKEFLPLVFQGTPGKSHRKRTQQPVLLLFFQLARLKSQEHLDWNKSNITHNKYTIYILVYFLSVVQVNNRNLLQGKIYNSQQKLL